MTEQRPSSNNELMMQVVGECFELAKNNESDLKRIEQTVWAIAGYVNEVWIQRRIPLYVAIPALAVVLG